MGEGKDFVFEPTSTSYAPDDARWIQQVNELVKQLQGNSLEVHKEVTPVPGKKGGLVELILAFGTSGAITAAVTVFKAWLKRDRSRRLVVKVKDGDRVKTIEVDADGMDQESVREAFRSAIVDK